MKKTIYTFILLAGTLSAYSQSPAQNEVKAQDKVQNAKADLKESKQELDAQYPAYKKDARIQIKANNIKIKDLRARLIKPRSAPANHETLHKIDELQARNVDLRNRLYITPPE